MAQLLSFRVYLSAETQKASSPDSFKRTQKTRKPFTRRQRGKNIVPTLCSVFKSLCFTPKNLFNYAGPVTPVRKPQNLNLEVSPHRAGNKRQRLILSF